MILDGKRVLVVGAGKTGVAVAQFLAGRGARVTVTDRRTGAELHGARESLGDSVQWELGKHMQRSFLDAELIVVSPGVPLLPEIAAAQKKGVPVTGEIELASRFIDAPIVGVTGTNGKSTVTALTGEIARQTGRATFVGGNLGTPLVTCVGTPAASKDGLVVVELSSFQLETVDEFRPRAGALLNLTPDHLDRYASLDDYGAAKLRLARRMGNGDVLVVNADDEWCARAVEPLRAQVSIALFSTRRRDPWLRAFVDGGDLVYPLEGGVERYPIAELNIIGRHNLSNALAALLMMRDSGLATYAQVRAGLRAFQPLPHRMQLVGEKRGVRFYDDSKATNVDSVVAGVDGFPTPFVLIAGGRDKGGSYAPMVAALQNNSCRAVLLIGEAADQIAAALTAAGERPPHERAATLEAAVARAAALTRPGDSVVLSPACSSYDMFQNYEHRGLAFRAAVEALP
ncbi:MAG TPA: UDP-N-acetylmuramoyl-L-alanine--D-glutamate ligase [Polyangia bacterium]|nr:UDP-N-acetylmuramoyl-L-alanine--D-glutamate ligase [Polyangia bacterium]